jgi:hypothetical protein
VAGGGGGSRRTPVRHGSDLRHELAMWAPRLVWVCSLAHLALRLGVVHGRIDPGREYVGVVSERYVGGVSGMQSEYHVELLMQ